MPDTADPKKLNQVSSDISENGAGSEPAITDTGQPQAGDLLRFTCTLVWPIYQKGNFSIWTVDIVGGSIRQPNGFDVRRVVMKGEQIRSEIKGGHLDVSGTWELRKNGSVSEYQIKAYSVSPKLPQSQEGMIAFLESSYIKGCGPATARKIVEAFGDDTWTVLDRDPDRLSEIKGLGRKQREKIKATYAENVGFRDIISDLAPFGIGPALAVRIAQNVPDVRRVIREDPFSLCDEKTGVGFKTADRIAAANGLDAASPSRIAAGLNYVLHDAEPSGHCYLTEDQLISRSWELLATDSMREDHSSLPAKVLESLVKSGIYIREAVEGEANRIYRRPIWFMEQNVAELLNKILHADEGQGENGPGQNERQSGVSGTVRQRERNEILVHQQEQIQKLVDEAAIRLGFNPAKAQREAAIRFYTEPLMILTGIPGSGKTSTLKLILEALGQEIDEVLLCAPTGRAARRMSEQTGRPAFTIHSALQLDPESDEMPDEFLDYKTIIIDEASMIDLRLMEKLLKRIEPGTRLLITGDPYQLPSVGAGNVLNDMIRSGVIPLVRLTTLFRQEEGSEIAKNAKAIREGSPDLIYNATSAFQTANGQDEAAELILKLYLKAIDYTGSEEEVVCLTPLRQRSATGSNALNRLLKEYLNPVDEDALSIQYGDKIFHTGDRVMLLRNSKLPIVEDEEESGQVSNGDTGRILGIFSDNDNDKTAVVEFNGEQYQLDAQHFQHMDWAYACTVHKSQGSEYKFVILCLMNAHHIMLKRNLIYTAFTRAKENIVIVGQKSAVNRAIRTEDAIRRQTGLALRLVEAERDGTSSSGEDGTDEEEQEDSGGTDWSIPELIADIEL